MATKPFMIRLNERQREAWTAAAARAGQSLPDWLREIADVAASEPPGPPASTRASGTASRLPLAAVRPARAAAPPPPKASGLTDGAHSARLAVRAPQSSAPDTRTVQRCSAHKKLPSDQYSQCGAQCRAEWGMTDGVIVEAVPAAE